VEDEQGNVIKSVQQVKLGQRVNTRVSDGTISADVAQVSERKEK
jgi:exonuclease VII large subunit